MMRWLFAALLAASPAWADAPNIQQYIDQAWADKDAQLAAAQALIAQQKALLDSKGPLFWYDWDETHAGEKLDLTGYQTTFSDDFDTMSVGRKDAAVRSVKWWAAVHSNFGNVAFMQPGDYYDPYAIVSGALRIQMTKLSATSTPPLPGGTNPWKAGLVQTVNGQGLGFSQAMGNGSYWEACVRLPTNGQANASKVSGAWPGVWLLSNNEFVGPVGAIMEEYDLLEAYGSDPFGLHSTIHYKPPFTILHGEWPSRQDKSNYVGMKDVKSPATGQAIWGLNGNLFNGQSKCIGVKIEADFYRQYVDGWEVARFPTQPWMTGAMYMLLNMTLYGPEATTAPFPQDMFVDSVRVMAK